MHLQTHSFCFRWQIFPPRQIVRLTRCIGVRGHPAMLIEMMSFVGYRWYPKYIVEEQFRDFNQTQYHCIVRIYPHHIGVTQPILFGHGIGMTENMAVQDAAYSCMTLLREEHAMLRDTSFRYILVALPGEEGYYTGLYSDHSAEDPVLQMTARFARDQDRDAPALHFELHSTRARLYRALTLLAPFVSVGSVEHDAIYPVGLRCLLESLGPKLEALFHLVVLLCHPTLDLGLIRAQTDIRIHMPPCFPMHVL